MDSIKQSNKMIVYCTYCAAEKNQVKTQLPAIELYKSERIARVFNMAKTKGLKFVILSGRYGIIDAHQKIEYYDHLLLASEVQQHSDLIASQLKSKKISELVFFMNSIEKDNTLTPYLDCIKKACAVSGTSLVIQEVDYLD